MLVVFQSPFADSREFLPNTFRLSKPDWFSLRLRSDFIHRFGVIEKWSRNRKVWTNEELYCKANRVFRFDNECIEDLAKHDYGLVVHSRRLYPIEVREIGKNEDTDQGIFHDSKAIGSLEVGFIHANKKKIVQNPMTSIILDNTIRRCLELPININLPGIGIKRDKLFNITDYVSRIYLYATTQKSARAAPH